MNKRIVISKENKIAYNYLIDTFSCNDNIILQQECATDYNILNIKLNADSANDFYYIVAKAIILSKKFAYLLAEFSPFDYNYANVACMSTLLYFDILNEIDKALKKIKGVDIISVDGVFDFQLNTMCDDWDELIDIGSVLIDNEVSDDIYNVIAFMLATRLNKKSLFLAQYPEILLANVTDGVVIDAINIYENNDFNLINMIIAECPSELIVEKGQLKDALINCLSRLVRVKEL